MECQQTIIFLYSIQDVRVAGCVCVRIFMLGIWKTNKQFSFELDLGCESLAVGDCVDPMNREHEQTNNKLNKKTKKKRGIELDQECVSLVAVECVKARNRKHKQSNNKTIKQTKIQY